MNASTAGRRITPRAPVTMIALTLALAAGGALAPPRAAAYHFPKCSRVLSRYHGVPGLGPKNVVEVLTRRGLSCAHAALVGISLNRAVLGGHLPLADFPAHVPGARPGRPFLLRTPLGRFRCRMTAAGSDFIDATCRRGRRHLRVYDKTH